MELMQAFFVGRTAELARYRQALEGALEKVQVLYLHAEGGYGKTRLLEQFRFLCVERKIPHADIIDFYEMENRQVRGLVQRIIAELRLMIQALDDEASPVSFFARFEEKVRNVQALQAENKSLQEISTLQREADQLFLDEYNELMGWFKDRGKTVSLFFDTFEALSQGGVWYWFLDNFLPAITNTVVAFAGRSNLDERQGISLLEIGPFNPAETEDFLHQREVFLPDFAKKLEQVYQYTDGIPLLLALTGDWIIRNPDRDISEIIGSSEVELDPKEYFKQQLVSNLLRLDLPNEFHAVWYMAHIFHRFDAKILAWITRKSLEEAAEIIGRVGSFPYVKYRRHSGNYQLQDTMRVLVNRYILDRVEDRDGSLRRDLSNRMVAYYDQALEAALAQGTAHEVQALQNERLYHLLYLDPQESFRLFETLFRQADKQGDIPMGDLLLGTANTFRADFTPSQQGWLDVFHAWLQMGLSIQEALDEAQELLAARAESLREDPNFDEIANSLGYVYRLKGNYDLATSWYNQALEANSHSARPKLERIETSAMILNNLGNIHRLQGLVNEAHYYSMSSLLLRQQLLKSKPKDKLGLANSYYYLALILREFGDNTGALGYLELAEDAYLEVQNRAGYANIQLVRAYVKYHINDYSAAIDLAEQSRQILEDELHLLSSRDLADAYDILGRLKRDLAVFQYGNTLQSDPTQARQALEERDKLLAEAERLIRRGYEIAEKSGDQFKLAESILSFVRLYYEMDSSDQALQWYEKGMAICRPRNYYLLMSYFEQFAGSTYFRLNDHDNAFKHFAHRALYAVHCRAMELGMTMNSLGKYLGRLDKPERIAYYADYLVKFWQNDPEYNRLKDRYPQIIELSEKIKELVA